MWTVLESDSDSDSVLKMKEREKTKSETSLGYKITNKKWKGRNAMQKMSFTKKKSLKKGEKPKTNLQKPKLQKNREKKLTV